MSATLVRNNDYMTNWQMERASSLQSLEGPSPSHRKFSRVPRCILSEPKVPTILCARGLVDPLEMVNFDARSLACYIRFSQNVLLIFS